MSEDHAARPHPPSSRRSAEARAQGHLPRAPLAGVMFVLLSLLASVWALGPRAFKLCTALLREPLELAAQGHGTEARERAVQLLGELTAVCAPALVAVVVALVLGQIVVQGPAFTHGVRGRASFPRLSVSRTASALWSVGALSIASLALGQWASFDLGTLGATSGAWAVQLVVLCVGALLVDVAFARARFHASLWLTRREYHDEQRAALGPPEARAARAEFRRSSVHGQSSLARPRARFDADRARASTQAGT